MNEQQQVPMLQAEPPSDEDKRLVALFSDIESKQLEFLDGAGKSIIERIATLLALWNAEPPARHIELRGDEQ